MNNIYLSALLYCARGTRRGSGRFRDVILWTPLQTFHNVSSPAKDIRSHSPRLADLSPRASPKSTPRNTQFWDLFKQCREIGSLAHTTHKKWDRLVCWWSSDDHVSGHVGTRFLPATFDLIHIIYSWQGSCWDSLNTAVLCAPSCHLGGFINNNNSFICVVVPWNHRSGIRC